MKAVTHEVDIMIPSFIIRVKKLLQANDVSILFYVDQPNDFDENPMLAVKLNDVGVANLSEKLGYPVRLFYIN